ncbi:hypothetical protein [Maricaulis maris]|uniref:Uncharacterized protein n=1 Tax=Maricaulis maris TaxID=74318 RepID=A0A495DLG9_9PROT|nr:hypothetical protein [Maricaulis maris]RKR03147.1 hypothetical protein C7435_1096 [Maricaulis maris]
MNPLALLLPNHRASVSAFILGIAILAALDAIRLAFGTAPVPGIIPMAVIWFCCFSLFANRRRHAGRSIGLAILPIVLSIVAKGIGTLIGVGIASFQAMITFAEEQGVDTSDTVAFNEAVSDPGFQEAFSTWIESDTQRAMEMFSQTAWPSYVGFWGVLAVFVLWFATMQRNSASTNQG